MNDLKLKSYFTVKDYSLIFLTKGRVKTAV